MFCCRFGSWKPKEEVCLLNTLLRANFDIKPKLIMINTDCTRHVVHVLLEKAKVSII